MNGKLGNNVTPARGRARFRPGHAVHVYVCVRVYARVRALHMCARSRLTHRNCRNAHYYLVSEIWLRSPFIKDLIDRRRLKRARPPRRRLRSYVSHRFLPFFSPFHPSFSSRSLPLNKLLSRCISSPSPLPAPVIKFASSSSPLHPFFIRGRYLRSFVFRILIASSPNWIRCLSIFAFLLFSNFPARHFTPLTCIFRVYCSRGFPCGT